MSVRKRYAGGIAARYLLLGSIVFLLLMGLVMIFSAASVSDYVNFGDSMYHLKRQVLFTGVGLLVMFIVQLVDYRRLRPYAWLFFWLCVAALVLVFVMGAEKGGATRWLDLGLFAIQPSEYAKLACVLVTALLLTQWRTREIGSADMWWRLIVACGLVAALILFQPDMGTMMLILLSVFVVLFLGGVNLRLLALLAVGGIGVAVGLVSAEPYRMRRYIAFVDPWSDPLGSGYQIIQAMFAFGSGGIDGVGVGMSRQKFFYLPAAHTDFIFAVIGEELGLIGAMSIVLAFGVFAYAGMRIALASKDLFGRLVAGGLTGMIVVQAIMNMAAVTSLMPVTGIPMPLVSYGGSSMTFTLACVGIILSVSSYSPGLARVSSGPSRSKELESACVDKRRWDSRSHLSSVSGGRTADRRRA